MDDNGLLLSLTATMWKFVLIGVAFLCLLAGFLLLGLGAMANRYKCLCLLGTYVILIVHSISQWQNIGIKLICLVYSIQIVVTCCINVCIVNFHPCILIFNKYMF